MTAIDLLYARRRRASRAQSSALESHRSHGLKVRLAPQVGHTTTVTETPPSAGESGSAGPQTSRPDHQIQHSLAGHSGSLRRAKLAEAWTGTRGRDRLLQESGSTPDWRPDPHTIVMAHGFNNDGEEHSQFGTTTRYSNRLGDRLFVTRRADLTRPMGQQAHYTDRLLGVSSNWDTRWEYHTLDGVRSVGYDVFGLQNHLGRMSGETSTPATQNR